MSNQVSDAFNIGIELGKQHQLLTEKRNIMQQKIEEFEDTVFQLESRRIKLDEQIGNIVKKIDLCRDDLGKCFSDKLNKDK